MNNKLSNKINFSNNKSLFLPSSSFSSSDRHSLFPSPISKRRFFYLSHFALFSCFILWFWPLTHPLCQQIDAWVFQTLNGSLVGHVEWQTIVGILNHRREARLNLLFAALFNLWAICATPPGMRMQRFKQTLYFWLCFQIGFTLQDYVINHLFHIERDSPSLVLGATVKLSEILQDPNIKDVSRNSFLGGHAFAMVYWASFTFLCAPRRVAILGALFALVLCLPRLFSGAHWFSDEVFGGILALVWLSWTTLFWGQMVSSLDKRH